MSDDKNVHSGHRKRLRSLVERAGIDVLTEVQTLELVLTYIFPRNDTNVLAHVLLEQFGSLSKVLDAPWQEVAKVKGMGEDSAKMLSYMPQILFLYRKNKLGEKQKLANRGDAQKFCVALMDGKNSEEFYAICLNAKSEVKSINKITQGKTSEVVVSTREIANIVSRENPSAIVLAHCHPELTAGPSPSDVASTHEIKKLLDMLNVQLIDHVIVGVESVFSFWENNLL